jgi:RNA polymerase sigma-70 factor (ECF subfamily)
LALEKMMINRPDFAASNTGPDSKRFIQAIITTFPTCYAQTMHINIQDLFRRIAVSDDREAYNQFFDHYYPKLIRFALRFVKQHVFAQDVVSEVLMRLFKHRHKLADVEHIEGYLYIMVKNQSLKYLRRVQKSGSLVQPMDEESDILIASDGSTPEGAMLNDEIHRVLQETNDLLPPRRQMIFRFVKEENLRYKDVAALLDISVKTVEVHMGLALKDVAKALEAYQHGERPARVVKIKKQ